MGACLGCFPQVHLLLSGGLAWPLFSYLPGKHMQAGLVLHGCTHTLNVLSAADPLDTAISAVYIIFAIHHVPAQLCILASPPDLQLLQYCTVMLLFMCLTLSCPAGSHNRIAAVDGLQLLLPVLCSLAHSHKCCCILRWVRACSRLLWQCGMCGMFTG
jgi:hypothetical protein